MKKRSGLGRGLDALLPSEEVVGAPEGRAGQQQVALEKIDRNPRQPREHFDEEDLDELAFSIKSLGILQPLLIRPLAGDRYELIAGERRLRAAKRAGLTEVPVGGVAVEHPEDEEVDGTDAERLDQ
jgi:ParB family chromosome partitioning protein